MSCFKKRIKFSAFIIIFIILIIFSCSKNEKSKEIVNPGTTAGSELSDKATLVFGENREKKVSNESSTPDNKGFTEIEKGDIRGQLFSINSISTIPEDMVMGSLLKFDIHKLNSGSFPYSIISFFTGASEGIIIMENLHPDWSENILNLYTTKLIEKDYNIRIGNIINTNGISRANIRLISKIGRVSGFVIADYFENKWLLSDISIDFVQLEDIYIRENNEFNPLSYSNILLNY